MLERLLPRRLRFTQARLDLLAILLLGLTVLALAIQFELFELLSGFQQQHEDWEADELFMAAMVLGWCGFAFGARRVTELKREMRFRKEAEQVATRMATHDSLTALPNRRALEQRFAQLVANHADEPMFLVLFDLDGFKSVNDVHGHAVGDRLLEAAAQRIGLALPEGDFACRLGGDEFALLLRSTKAPATARQLIVQLAALISQPVETSSGRLAVAATYGVAEYLRDGRSLADLMRRADLALYQGKHVGKNVIRFFDSSTDHHLEESSRAAQLVREALDEGYLHTVYQPIVNLDRQQVVGFEALARLTHPRYGEIPPSRFIPAAEQNGLVREVTTLLLTRACTDALSWPEPMFLAFNLSAVDLHDEDLPERIWRVLDEVGLPPQRLELEVTETAIIKDIPLARRHLEALRALGIRIAIDDFGTGYSSLAQISRFTFDKLKIDREFVSAMCHNEKDGKIVRSIIHLSHGLDMPAVAEGIETEDQFEWLSGAGCHYGQGYYFSRPVAPQAIPELLARVDEDGALPPDSAMAGLPTWVR